MERAKISHEGGIVGRVSRYGYNVVYKTWYFFLPTFFLRQIFLLEKSQQLSSSTDINYQLLFIRATEMKTLRKERWVWTNSCHVDEKRAEAGKHRWLCSPVSPHTPVPAAFPCPSLHQTGTAAAAVKLRYLYGSKPALRFGIDAGSFLSLPSTRWFLRRGHLHTG